MSKSPSSPADSKSEKLRTTALRTFWRRNQSIVAFDRMRWNSSGNSAAGRSAYFSGQPDHRVLHDVERRVVVPDGVDGALEGTLLDALQKVGEFFVGRQGSGPSAAAARSGAIISSPLARARRTRDSAPRRCDNCRLHDSFRSPAPPEPRQRLGDRAGTAPASRGRGKVHRWFFVREIHRGSKIMEMSAADAEARRLRRRRAPPPAAEPNGSEILVRCLQAENVKLPLGLPRRRGPLHLRRALQAGHDPARAGAPRAGGRARRRRLCARHRRGRRRAGHLRPGRDQCRHRHRDRLHGLDPDGDHHRPGADAGDRPRRLPGVRHRRHHAPDRQAQLPGQGRARPGADDEEGLPHRPHRPARPGGGRHPEGRVDGKTAPFHYPATVEMRSYNPVRKGHGGQIRKAVQLLLRRQAPVHLHRRRRHPRQCLGRAARARRPARLPVHQHADGPGRLSGERPEVPRHARHARHLRSQHDDAELRRAARRRRALRRPRDRQPEALRVGRAQDHPHRHRPVVDLQAREGRHPDRRRRQGRAAAS